MGQTYIQAASGGTESTSGNFKIHTFTGDGTFTVTKVGNAAGGSNVLIYMVVVVVLALVVLIEEAEEALVVLEKVEIHHVRTQFHL